MRELRNDIIRRIRLYFGVTAGFGIVSYTSFAAGVPILIAPLAASTCILFAAPDSPFAKPKNVILGHALSAAIGVMIYQWMGETWLANVICVALSVALMDITETMHPPAAATSLFALMTHQGYEFIFRPVALGACVLILASEMVKCSMRDKRYKK